MTHNYHSDDDKLEFWIYVALLLLFILAAVMP
jgi:hypothetical protein